MKTKKALNHCSTTYIEFPGCCPKCSHFWDRTQCCSCPGQVLQHFHFNFGEKRETSLLRLKCSMGTRMNTPPEALGETHLHTSCFLSQVLPNNLSCFKSTPLSLPELKSLEFLCMSWATYRTNENQAFPASQLLWVFPSSWKLMGAMAKIGTWKCCPTLGPTVQSGAFVQFTAALYSLTQHELLGLNVFK